MKEKQFVGRVSRSREHSLAGFCQGDSSWEANPWYGDTGHRPRVLPASLQPAPSSCSVLTLFTGLRAARGTPGAVRDAHKAAHHVNTLGHVSELLQTERPLRQDGPRTPLQQDRRTQGQRKRRGQRLSLSLSRHLQTLRPAALDASLFPLFCSVLSARSQTLGSVQCLQVAQVGPTGLRRRSLRPVAPRPQKSFRHFAFYIVHCF